MAGRSRARGTAPPRSNSPLPAPQGAWQLAFAARSTRYALRRHPKARSAYTTPASPPAVDIAPTSRTRPPEEKVLTSRRHGGPGASFRVTPLPPCYCRSDGRWVRGMNEDEDELSPQFGRELSASAYFVPSQACLCDYTFLYESAEEKASRLGPSYVGHDDGFTDIVTLIGAEKVQQLPDPKPSTGYEVWGAIFAFSASAWQLIGLPGAIQIGQKARHWLQARRGRSGSLAALLPVAIAFIHERIPGSTPDLQRVQAINPCTESRHAIEYQAVFLFRIYDRDGTRVYLVEVDSNGNLVQISQREIALFEQPQWSS